MSLYSNQILPSRGSSSTGSAASQLPECSNATISNCSGCQIPLASYCSRTKLSVYLSYKLVQGPSLMKFICATYDIDPSQLELLSYVKNDDLELCGYCTRIFEKMYFLREKIADDIRQTRSVLSRLMPLSFHDLKSNCKNCQNRHQDARERTSDSSLITSHNQQAEGTAEKIQRGTSDTFSDQDLVETLYALGSGHAFGNHIPQQLPHENLSHDDASHSDQDDSPAIADSSTNEDDDHDLRNPTVDLDTPVNVISTGTGFNAHMYGEMLLQNRKSQVPDTDNNQPGEEAQPEDLQVLYDGDQVTKPRKKSSTRKSAAEGNTTNTSAKPKKRKRKPRPKNRKEYKCMECDRMFPNLIGLSVHAKIHDRQIYTCDGCKRKFKIEKNFIRHKETARCTEKKHPCPTCGKLFKNKDKVKRHLISLHSDSKPFSCESCGKGFRSASDLKFHEVNAHICGDSDSKLYQCDECGKRFKSYETLKSHETYSHKMEKKHFCSTCGKGFPLLATLKIHEISHSTERPYMCTYCGRTYKHFSDLKSHEVLHYNDEEKPFGCPICGAKFYRKDLLRLHQTRERHFGPDLPVQKRAKKLKVTHTAKPQDAAPQKIRPETTIGETASSSNAPSTLNADKTHLSALSHSVRNPTRNPVALSYPAIVNPSSTSALPFSDPRTNPETNLNSTNQPSFNLSSQTGHEVITDLLRIMYEIP